MTLRGLLLSLDIKINMCQQFDMSTNLYNYHTLFYYDINSSNYLNW